ncbi:MAG: RNA repair transcriptional activator RtcR [Thermoguttaceae bacterium]
MGEKVIFGFLGSKLDAGNMADRWKSWRPTVALGMHEELLLKRYELFYQPNETALLKTVVDDLASISPETDVNTHPIPLQDPWDFEEVYGKLHDLVREYSFNTDKEEYLVHITTGSHVEQICLFLMTESRHIPGKLIQCSPPHRYKKEKVTGTYKIIDLDLSRYDRLASRFALDRQTAASFLKSGIETKNRDFNRLIDRIEQVVTSCSAPVLLMGATGVGKSQLARRIYELKRQRKMLDGPFVEVNCATLRGDSSMSALFGHTKGAFTGAVGERAGLLRTADKGMLFLDEIGELGLDEQAMLLRAVEEKRFLPVGSDKDVCSDFQLIAGTNRDLKIAVQNGRFRDDLLARINLWTFRLPGLAERREDIEPNVNYELDQYTVRSGNKVSFNTEARTRFIDFATSFEASWKANFRDLNAAITRMITLSHGGRISQDVVEEEIERLRLLWTETNPNIAEMEKILYKLVGNEQYGKIDLFDLPQLLEVIRVCRESASISEAGRKLFNISREEKKSSNDADRLRKYLSRFGINWNAIKLQ